MTYGQMIRAARESRGMSQEKLAALIGCGITLLTQIERGARPPCDLTSAFHMTAVRLLHLNDEPFAKAIAIETGSLSLAGLSVEQRGRVIQFAQRLRAQGPDAPPSSGRRRWDP